VDALRAGEILLFKGLRLNIEAGGLYRADESGTQVPVSIGSRALDLLVLLVTRRGDLVSKDEIMTVVWPGLIVAESNLPTQIWALRRVLDQGRLQGSCIQTVSGRGYRFVAPVTQLAAPARPAGPWISSAAATRQPIAAPRLSLVVLPFDSFSDRRDHHYFAHRITDDLTTDLSRFTGMRVTSRRTALTYRSKPVGAKQIGRELGIRYVLEGSVQPSANHVRVNARLIDAGSDTHLWAERFDCDPDNRFGVQDEITRRTAVGLYAELLRAEASQTTEHPDALEYILQGRAAKLKPVRRDDYAEAIRLFESALALDPHSAEAQGWLADTLASRAINEMADSAAADIANAAGLATQAVAKSPHSAFAHFAKGRALSALGRHKEAIPEYEAARAINPSWPHPYGHLGECKLWTGSTEDTIPLVKQAIRICTGGSFTASWYLNIGRVHLVHSHPNEAIMWLEKACSAEPELPSAHAWLASAYALNAEIERAAAELAWARGLSRDGRYCSVARSKAVGHFGVPKIRALVEDTYFSGLRKAGMPDE
jgi:TolB-like protein